MSVRPSLRSGTTTSAHTQTHTHTHHNRCASLLQSVHCTWYVCVCVCVCMHVCTPLTQLRHYNICMYIYIYLYICTHTPCTHTHTHTQQQMRQPAAIYILHSVRVYTYACMYVRTSLNSGTTTEAPACCNLYTSLSTPPRLRIGTPIVVY